MNEVCDEGKVSFNNSKKLQLPFDFALDIIIRDSNNREIFEDFLSEVLRYLKFLSCDGRITIEEVKDEFPEFKAGLRKGVDVFARNDKGEGIIIKVCCFYNSDSFLDKSVHNVSNTIMKITDGIKKGVDVIYKTRKTFYVNILYKSNVYRIKALNSVPIGTKIDKDSVYYKREAFEETKQVRMRSEVEEIDVFDHAPEIVVVNLDVFEDDVIKHRVHEWMYLIKNGDVKDTFKSNNVRKTLEIIRRLSEDQSLWNEFYDWMFEDIKAVEYFFTFMMNDCSVEDREKLIKEAIKRLMVQGMSIESVAVLIGCPLNEILALEEQEQQQQQ